jgi:hypothetical protein
MSAEVTPIRHVKPATIEDPYLSPQQVCDLVPGMTVVNLKYLRANGRGPAYFKPTSDRGHTTLYRRSDVVAWVERSRVSTREQP